jgi:hypothetical protein
VYLKIVYIGVYVVTAEALSSRPAQSAGIYYRLIATATVTSGDASSPIQTEFGDIEITGRYV